MVKVDFEQRLEIVKVMLDIYLRQVYLFIVNSFCSHVLSHYPQRTFTSV